MSLRNFAIFFLFLTFTCGDVDFPIYKIQIKNEPIKFSTIDGNHLEVLSLNGQQFSCSIPDVAPQNDRSEPLIHNTSEYIKNVFNTWNTTNCLSAYYGWWTYKLCIGKEVIQYRDEQGVAMLSSSLGVFNKDFDWSKAEKSDPQVSGKYHSQFYVDGTICDVTGKPRSTEVRYGCNAMAINPAIIGVAEIETCSYVLTVASTDLCAIPVLAPKKAIEASPIVCSPALSDESYQKYQDAQKKKAALKKKQDEELLYETLLPLLPAKRLAAREKVLKTHRSYQKRVERENLREAKKLIENFQVFLDVVEDNFYGIPEEQLVLKNYTAEVILEWFQNLLRFDALDFELEALPVDMTDTILSNHNLTIEIAYIVLKRIRNSFENSIAMAEIPETMKMLRHSAYLIDKLQDIRTTKALHKIRQALEAYHPYQPDRQYRPTYEFFEYLYSPQVTAEREVLRSLNSTIESARNALKFSHLRMYMSTLIGADFANKPPVKLKFEDYLQDIESDMDSTQEQLRVLQEVLVSPKMQSALKFFPAEGRESGVVVKTSFQNYDRDKMAIVITLENEGDSSFEENAKNYNVKIDVN